MEVLAFDHDEDTEAHCAAHGIWPEQLDELLEGHYVVIRNRRRRTGTHLLIGRDYAGRCIAVPMLRTGRRGIWRAVTAWYCRASEESRLG